MALARALYSRPDVLLLDDPLSALDAAVARSVFDNAVRTFAGPCIMVCSQMYLLPQSSCVMVIDRGKVVDSGTYSELMSRKCTFLAETAAQSSTVSTPSAAPVKSSGSDGSSEKGIGDKVPPTSHFISSATSASLLPSGVKGDDNNGSVGQLVEKEQRASGAVSWDVYLTYLTHCGKAASAWILAGALASHGIGAAKDFQLSSLTHSGKGESLPNEEGSALATNAAFQTYISLCLVTLAIICFREIALVRVGLVAAGHFHRRMMQAVLHAPVSYFERTPLGRTVTRFASDLPVLDESLPDTIGSWMDAMLFLATTLAVIAYLAPPFVLPLVGMIYLYGQIRAYYLASSRELKRMDGTSRAPICSFLAESLEGAASIRAFNWSEHFDHRNTALMDASLSVYHALCATNRWMGFRLEMLGAAAVFSAALLIIMGRGTMSVAAAGLALTYCLRVTQSLSFGIRSSATLESQFNAVGLCPSH